MESKTKKFRIGQTLVIVGNTGNFHPFKTGEKVKVMHKDLFSYSVNAENFPKDDRWCWIPEQDLRTTKTEDKDAS